MFKPDKKLFLGTGPGLRRERSSKQARFPIGRVCRGRAAFPQQRRHGGIEHAWNHGSVSFLRHVAYGHRVRRIGKLLRLTSGLGVDLES
ncbi:MAG: hypothetical protein DME26_19150 [Verrucomicrobia bacterium]|nr:MAG: hypothetical protein DME26_19150 [Verrucomicrobiota bacterium]